MSNSKLPLELLYNISNFLEVRDLAQAGLACREWSIAFMEVLWDDIHIQSTTQAHRLHETLIRHTPDARNYRKGTSRLTLHLHTPQIDPKLAKKSAFGVFKAQAALYKDIGILKALKHSFKSAWKSLKPFGAPKSMTLTKDQILFTLCHLPHLEYLDISNGRGHTMQFNWRDLNILHQSLQKLKCLKLGINLETISLKDISLISKMDKATKLLCLEFCSKDVDLGWLYYWANKYPNIRTITWVSKRGMSRLIDVIYNGYPEMRTLDSPFRHLDTINLNYKEGQSRMTHVLLDKLHELNIPIKNISCAIKIRISDLTDGAETTDKILKFSQTLLSLDLQIQGRSHDTLAISQALCYCPLLVDLRITAPFMTFKINEILDTFPSLKTLHLSSKRVFIEQNEPLGMHHGLKEFWMRDTQTVYRLFSYLSNRCRQLKCLFLRGVLIPGIARAKNAVVPIQMKYSSLDTFQMIDIVFSYQLNYSLGSYCETAVLFKITQYNSVGQDGDTNSVTWHRNYLSTKNKPSEWQRIRGSYDWNEILKKKRYSALAGLVSLECVSVKNVII